MEAILKYDHVELSYLGQPVVQDVSFSLEPGEILGIVGESGSGKSTLIKAAMGLLGSEGCVTKGQICYRGRNLLGLPSKELRKLNGPELGYIFQNAGTDTGDRQAASPGSSACNRGNSSGRMGGIAVSHFHPKRKPIPAAIFCSGS